MNACPKLFGGEDADMLFVDVAGSEDDTAPAVDGGVDGATPAGGTAAAGCAAGDDAGTAEAGGAPAVGAAAARVQICSG